MLTQLLLLAQVKTPVAQPDNSPGILDAMFTWTNGILVAAIIVILVAYKIYKDKTMK